MYQKDYYNRNSVPIDMGTISPPVGVNGLEVLHTIFDADEVHGIPRNDLSLIGTPLPPDVADILGQLHRAVNSQPTFKDDKSAHGAVIPYQFQDSSELQAYFKAVGLDDKVINRVLDGDSVNEILNDVMENNDESA